jgi:PST family polysaccharide transporter
VPTIATAGGAFFVSRFRPGLPHQFAKTLPILTFGGFAGAANFVNYFQQNLDVIVIGYFCGTADTGLFTRAVFLKTLPMAYAIGVLQDIMLPSLAALRGDVARFASAYRKCLKTVAFIGCPVAVWLGITAHESIYTVYGPQWTTASSILIWLSLPATMLPIHATTAWLYLSSGRSKCHFVQAVIVTPAVAAASLLGVHWGPTGVAVAAAIVLPLPVTIGSLFAAHRALGLDFRLTIAAIRPVLLACLIAAGAGVLVAEASPLLISSWQFTYAMKTVAAVIAYLAAVRYFEGTLPVPWTVRDVVDRLLALVPRSCATS